MKRENSSTSSPNIIDHMELKKNMSTGLISSLKIIKTLLTTILTELQLKVTPRELTI